MRTRGFTVAELLVVLAIVGLAAAAAVPALRGGATTGLEPAADSLAAVVDAARNEAMRASVPVVLLVDAADGSWTAEADPSPEAAPEPFATGRLPLGPETRLVVAGRRVWRARWDARGRARAPPLLLADPAGRVVLRVDPWTGRPEVDDG